MYTYKEIAELAEDRVDIMAGMKPEEALKCDIITAMEVLLETVGVCEYNPEIDIQIDGISMEHRKRVVEKAMEYSGKVMETALKTTNEFFVNRGRFAHHLFKICDKWLKAHDNKGNPTQGHVQGSGNQS